MRLILALLAAMPTFALSNCVTIYEAAGSAQTARPMLVHRWFLRGEMAAYPKPFVGGVAPTAWQADVKSRWDDGSVRAAYISWRQDFAANGSAQACFQTSANRSSAGDDTATTAAALTQAQMLAFDTGGGEGTWAGIVEGALNSVTYSANAKTMLAAGNWSYWLSGPVVTWVIAEDRSTALSYDFGWEYDSGTTAWKAPTNDKYKSLHPIFCLQFWPDPDGAGSLSAWPGVEVDAVLWNASTTRLQRIPLDSLRVLTGDGTTESYSQANANFIARRTWHTAVWSGAAPAAVVIDHNLAYLIASGSLPSYDHRLQVVAGQADADLADYATRVGAEKPEWGTGGYAGNYVKYQPNTGGRGDIGLIPRFHIRYLYAMGNSGYTTAKKLTIWSNLVVGNADAYMGAPVHFLETDTTYRTGSREFFTGTTAAFGRALSIESRLTTTLADGYTKNNSGFETNSPTTPDGIFPACTADPCDGDVNRMGEATAYAGWTPDPNHWPAAMYIPWLLTGRPVYLWEQQFLGAFAPAGVLSGRAGTIASPACTAGGLNNSGRFGAWGIMYANANQRRNAWGLREVYFAAVVSPDSTPERQYFEKILKNNDEAVEGYYDISDGLYPPSDSACAGYAQATTENKWCAGKMSLRFFGSNPLRITYRGQEASAADGPFAFTSGVCAAIQVPHSGYLASVYAAIRQGGVFRVGGQPIFSRSAAELDKFQIDLVTAPGVMPSWTSTQRMGVVNSSGTIRYPQTWAEYAGHIDTQRSLYSTIDASTLTVLVEGNTGSTYAPFDGTAGSAIKVDNEWMLVDRIGCNGCASYDNRYNTSGAVYVTFNVARRGIWGTVAAAHTAGAPVLFQRIYKPENTTGGYAFIALAGLALAGNTQGTYASGRSAYERMSALVEGQHYFANDTNSPMWAFVPRALAEVQATAGVGTLTLRYNAPDRAPCTYAVATALADSSDSGDTSDGGGAVARTVTVTGLSAGNVRYRMSCGAGRVIGTATIQ